MTKSTITPNERLQLLGLLTLAQQAYMKEEAARQAARDLISADNLSTFDDWFTEGIYEGYTIDKILENSEIEIGETE